MPDLWGISSVGRAPALQAGGREFESLILHESSEENAPRMDVNERWTQVYLQSYANEQTCEDARRASVMSKTRSVCESAERSMSLLPTLKTEYRND